MADQPDKEPMNPSRVDVDSGDQSDDPTPDNAGHDNDAPEDGATIDRTLDQTAADDGSFFGSFDEILDRGDKDEADDTIHTAEHTLPNFDEDGHDGSHGDSAGGSGSYGSGGSSYGSEPEATLDTFGDGGEGGAGLETVPEPPTEPGDPRTARDTRSGDTRTRGDTRSRDTSRPPTADDESADSDHASIRSNRGRMPSDSGGDTGPAPGQSTDATVGITRLIEKGLLTPLDEHPARDDSLALLEHRYEIIAPLGEGGMGVVFLAYDRQESRNVAIKTIRAMYVDRPRAREQFVREAEVMARIDEHPNVMSVTAIGNPGRPYYVMEHMTGGSIGQLIKSKHNFSREQIVELALHVGRAIQHVHKVTGRIHRDLKPENVLLDHEGTAKLCDFGLVREVGEGAEGLRAGTLAYMPPEVLRGDKHVGFEWDIYSFGALLYAMLTGQRPYEEALKDGSTGKSRFNKLREEIIKRPPRPIRRVNKQADPALADIAEWAMAREARDRYVRIDDIVADLERVRKGERPLGPRQIKPQSRLLVALVLFILLGAGNYFLWTNIFGNDDNGGGGKEKDKISHNGGNGANGGKGNGKDAVVIPPDPKAIWAGFVPEKLSHVNPETNNRIIDVYGDGIDVRLMAPGDQPPDSVTSFTHGDPMRFLVRSDRAGYLLIFMLCKNEPQEKVILLSPPVGQSQHIWIEADETILINGPLAEPPLGDWLVKAAVCDYHLVPRDGEDFLQRDGFRRLDLQSLRLRYTDAAARINRDVDWMDLQDNEWGTAELPITIKPADDAATKKDGVE